MRTLAFKKKKVMGTGLQNRIGCSISGDSDPKWSRLGMILGFLLNILIQTEKRPKINQID